MGMAPMSNFFWNPITELIFAWMGALKLFAVAGGILKYGSWRFKLFRRACQENNTGNGPKIEKVRAIKAGR